MTSQTYDALNKAWKSTCRIVLGDEVGELKDYEGWLGEYLPPVEKRKSHLSGREITLANPRYPDGARFVSMEEITERKADPLSINDIKDIDSIVRAVSEQWEYAGNRVQGNSAMIETSDIVVDSQSVSGSTDIGQSQYVSSSFMIRSNSKYVFGSGWCGKTEFAIRHVAGFNNSRILESTLVGESSDIFFCHNIIGCMDAMFSFSQRNKRHCIGNLELPKDKYAALKSKLLAEIREELEGKKRFPSLMEMVPAKQAGCGAGRLSLPIKEERTSMEPIEKAFSSTFRIVLGCKPGKLGEYEDWLMTGIPPLEDITSPFGHRTFLPVDKSFSCFSKFPRSRTVSFCEAMELGKRKLDEPSVGSLEKIRDGLRDIAFFTIEYAEGVNSNNIKSPLVFNGSHNYRIYDATYSEYAALGSMSLNSKYTFGCYRVVESQFCIKCYNSLKLSRCFEVDTSSNCLDSMFCHNSEALSDCMFCFNIKGKRHAIGNVDLEPGKYRTVRGALVGQIADELETKKGLHLDIFGIGAMR
jgi:hypothetical protein